MWQLTVGIELHEFIQKLILEILAIPASSGAIESLFSQGNMMSKQKKPYVTKKEKFWCKMNKMKFKLSKIFFMFSRTNTRIYTILHKNTHFFFKNTRIHVTVFANTRNTRYTKNRGKKS